MSQLGLVGLPTLSEVPLTPAFQRAVVHASAQPAGWAAIDPAHLAALITASLPCLGDPAQFEASALGRWLQAWAGSPLLLWYSDLTDELTHTRADSLLAEVRRQLIESEGLGGELYIDHDPWLTTCAPLARQARGHQPSWL